MTDGIWSEPATRSHSREPCGVSWGWVGVRELIWRDDSSSSLSAHWPGRGRVGTRLLMYFLAITWTFIQRAVGQPGPPDTICVFLLVA